MEHDEVGVEHVEAVVAIARIVGGDADGGGGVEVVGTMRGGVGDGAMPAVGQKRREGVGRAVGSDEEGLVTVLLLDGLELVGHIVDGLVPADAFPFVLAAQIAVGIVGAPVLALHGVLKAVDAEALLLLGLAAHASALLRVVEGILVRVVGLLADNGAVFNHDLVHATSAAVVPTGGRYPFAVLGGVGREFVLFVSLKRGIRGAARHRQGGNACGYSG